MARRFFRYYIGGNAQHYLSSEEGELPFRIEELPLKNPFENGNVMDVALNVGSSIFGASGAGNIASTVSAGDYAAFRAAHFYSFYQGAGLL